MNGAARPTAQPKSRILGGFDPFGLGSISATFATSDFCFTACSSAS